MAVHGVVSTGRRSIEGDRVGRLVAGVDSSTQATKVVIVDAETGLLAAEGRAAHTVSGRDGARESEPRMWWRALADALATTGMARKVSAISVAAQQHGLVALDADGEPVRTAVLWNDTRAARDAQNLVGALGGPGRWADHIGSVPVAAFTVSSWAWLRRTDPDLADRVAGVRLPHDYLTELLTGSAVTDRGDASGTGWWSTRSGDYSDEVLGLPEVSLSRAALPRVLGPGDVAGTVTGAAARETGLPEGIPVGTGTGDNMAAALGIGLGPGQVAMSLGTSGTVLARAEEPTSDPEGVIAGFADACGGYLPLACTLNCTQAVDRLAGLLGIDREAASDDTDLVVLPYLDGERTPDLPRAGGTILGLRHDTDPGEILLAAYRGAVASLLQATARIERLVPAIGPSSPLILIGGGARGATWQRTVSALSGRRVIVPKPVEFVALGAAAQAAAALGGPPAEQLAMSWARARPSREILPSHSDEVSMARIEAAISAISALYADAD